MPAKEHVQVEVKNIHGDNNDAHDGPSLRSVREDPDSIIDATLTKTKTNSPYNDSILSWFKKRNGDTLQGALAFVPWVLQQAYFEGGLAEGQIVVHRGTGAVVFADASGFTELTGRLAQKSNGAELLSQSLQGFFTPLIDLINNYRGDVIKFSGDALMIYFQAFDDTKSPKYNCVVPPHGTYGLPDLGPMATAVLRASACCIEIHKRLHMFDTGVEGVYFCLHIGVGCGQISILQVGGETPPETHVRRLEYLIAGPPLEQIKVAEPLAQIGQTCLSPQAWEYVKDCVIEGRPLESRPEYHLLLRMDESKYTFPTIKHAAMENDNRADNRFRLQELNVIRKFIPSAVFKQIECGTLTYVNEMRNITSIFINGAGLDVMSSKGAAMAQELMVSVQRACYQHEGTLNKFMIDDKGTSFLLVFGLPPLVHVDDPTRAVLSCFDMVKVFKRLDLVGRFGVTTGRSYCGVCGAARRMEYTVLGDCVNMAARLMGKAHGQSILCDEETKNRSTTEVIFNALAPIKVKGKDKRINVFQPVKKERVLTTGITKDRTIRFPWYDSPFAGAMVCAQQHAIKPQQKQVQLLCGVKTWAGIVQGSQMLGGNFSKLLHQSEQVFDLSEPKIFAPTASPFSTGGVIVLEGQSGMGKMELAEHLVVYSALNLRVMPVFGTMGPRPGDAPSLALQLLTSSLEVFRSLNLAGTLPVDDFAAMQKLTPPDLAMRLPVLKEALQDRNAKERQEEILNNGLEVAVALLAQLVKTTSILMVLQFEYGTSLFPKNLQDMTIFWEAISKLTKLTKAEMTNGPGNGHKPLVMMIICKESEDSHPAIKLAHESGSFVHLKGLTEENILEYMGNYLDVPEQMVPQPLRQFVGKVTLGNPRHIRETIEQLLENNLQVHIGANSLPKHIECKDLEKINISSWQHTAMVGGTVCLLESLDPLEAAVLKMSTCFEGTFTLPDLAASTCSRWADSTHFDYLRIFRALGTLVKSGVIEQVSDEEIGGGGQEGIPPNPTSSESLGGRMQTLTVVAVGKKQSFQTRNLLIRAVGGSMVLEAQKKSVKRQALIDRALWRELPARMEDLARKRNAQHIPWYYEQAFRRM